MPARTSRAQSGPPGERAALVDPLRVKGPRFGPGPGAVALGVVVLAGLCAGGYGWLRFVETDRELGATRVELDDTTARLSEQTERGDALAADLDATREDLDATRDDLDRSRADAALLTRQLDEARERHEQLGAAFAERSSELGRVRAALAAARHEHSLPDEPPGEPLGPPRRGEFASDDGRLIGEVEWFDGIDCGVARFTRIAEPGAGVYRLWAGIGSERVLLGVITSLPDDGAVEVGLRAEVGIESPELIEVSYDDGSGDLGESLSIVGEARFDR